MTPGSPSSVASPPALIGAFTTDVEDYFQAEALREFCPREQWASFEDRTEPNTERVLAILDRRGVRGTFFVLGWTAGRHPALVRRIADAGHEIASHGFAHELIYRQTPDAFRDDVRRARGLLQDLSGQEVIGYRAPSYTIVARTLWALPILADEGHRYDSSVFPIRRRKYGIPDAPRSPYRVGGEAGDLVEFPLPALRFGSLGFPATGGAFLRLLPLGFQIRAVRRLGDEHRPVALNVHPWELDPGQPRFAVGLRTRWTHYHNLGQTEHRLERLLNLGRFGTMTQVLQERGFLPLPVPAA